MIVKLKNLRVHSSNETQFGELTMKLILFLLKILMRLVICIQKVII